MDFALSRVLLPAYAKLLSDSHTARPRERKKGNGATVPNRASGVNRALCAAGRSQLPHPREPQAQPKSGYPRPRPRPPPRPPPPRPPARPPPPPPRGGRSEAWNLISEVHLTRTWSRLGLGSGLGLGLALGLANQVHLDTHLPLELVDLGHLHVDDIPRADLDVLHARDERATSQLRGTARCGCGGRARARARARPR
jgi:hypothetical protein